MKKSNVVQMGTLGGFVFLTFSAEVTPCGSKCPVLKTGGFSIQSKAKKDKAHMEPLWNLHFGGKNGAHSSFGS